MNQGTGENTISLYRQFHNIPLQKLPQNWWASSSKHWGLLPQNLWEGLLLSFGRENKSFQRLIILFFLYKILIYSLQSTRRMRTFSQLLLSQIDKVVICPNGPILLIPYWVSPWQTKTYQSQDKEEQSNILLWKKECKNCTEQSTKLKKYVEIVKVIGIRIY